jgi:hypothetical protein
MGAGARAAAGGALGKQAKAQALAQAEALSQAQARLSAARTAVSDHLAALAPASVDVELRSLSLGAGSSEGCALLRALLRYLAAELRSGRRFDLAQAHANCALTVHQAQLLESELAAELRALACAQAPGALKLRSLLDSSLAMVSSFLGQ